MASPRDIPRSIDTDFVVLDGSPGMTSHDGSEMDLLKKFNADSLYIKHDVETIICERDMLTDSLRKTQKALQEATVLLTSTRSRCLDEIARLEDSLETSEARSERLQVQVNSLHACLTDSREKLEKQVSEAFELQQQLKRVEAEKAELIEERSTMSFVNVREFGAESKEIAELSEAEQRRASEELLTLRRELLDNRDNNELLVKEIEGLKKKLDELAERHERQIKEKDAEIAGLGQRILELLAEKNNSVPACLKPHTRDEDALEIQLLSKQLAIANLEKIKAQKDRQTACESMETLRKGLADQQLVNQDELKSTKLLLKEQTARTEKLQASYNELLKTWQDFESNQPVILPGGQQRQSIDAAARQADIVQQMRQRDELATANALIVTLRGRIENLQAECADLQARRASRFSCPICSQSFNDQPALIQHASACEGS